MTAPRCRRHTDIQIGMAIRLVREAVGLSQAELGRRCGQARTRIVQWETHYRVPGPGQVLRLAEALGVPASALIAIATGGR